MFFFFFQAEDGIRDLTVTGVQTCALPILDTRKVGDSSLLPYTGEYQSWDISMLRLRSEEHTSELQSQSNLVCRLLLEKKKNNHNCQPFSSTMHLYLCSLTRYLDITSSMLR